MTEKVKQALSTIRSFGICFGGASLESGIEPTVGRADSGRIEVDFEELVEDLVPALKERDSAFGLSSMSSDSSSMRCKIWSRSCSRLFCQRGTVPAAVAGVRTRPGRPTL